MRNRFILEIYPNANTPENINSYVQGIETILGPLHLKVGVDSNFIIDATADIQNYPRLWSLTSRVGASFTTLAIKDERAGPSIYEKALARIKLAEQNKQFNNEQKAAIKTALEKLEAYQRESILLYLARLRKETAKDLLERLNNNQYSTELQAEANKELKNELANLIQQTQEIMNMQIPSTRAEVFDYTKKVNDLRNKLLLFHQRLVTQFGEKSSFKLSDQNSKSTSAVIREDTINSYFDHRAKQLSFVTKRELDYYYDEPKDYTGLDKARLIAKGVTSTIGALASMAALILFCIPGLQPVGAAVALVGLIALVPVFDSIWEVGRNLYYGRSPTKAQALELGIVLPLISLFVVGGHTLAPIGAAIAGKSAAITQTLKVAAAFIQTKFTNGLGALVHAGGSFLNFFLLKKSAQPQLEQHVKDPVLPFDTSVAILKNNVAKTPDDLNKVNSAQETIKRQEHAKNMGYLYHRLNGNEHSIHFLPSHSEEIYKWNAGFFGSKDPINIANLWKKYKSLPATATKKAREDILNEINNTISQHQNHDDKQHYQELQQHIAHELEVLAKVSNPNANPYLTYKPR